MTSPTAFLTFLAKILQPESERTVQPIKNRLKQANDLRGSVICTSPDAVLKKGMPARVRACHNHHKLIVFGHNRVILIAVPTTMAKA